MGAGGLVSCGGFVSIALVLILIILKFLKLRKEYHMKHNKNRTITSDLGNAGTETIWAIGTSIAASAVQKYINIQVIPRKTII